MATEIVRRGRNYTIERDPTWEPGRHRLTATIHDQWYWDENDQWQAVDENIVNSDLPTFGHMAKAMVHAIHAKADGTRRWYPRRNLTTEYVEFGRPQYWTGSAWADLPLGTPTRTGNSLVWDQTNFSLQISINWHRVKLDVTLKNAAAARRVRWPVSLTGLTWDNWDLLSGSTVVGSVQKPHGYYLSTPGNPKTAVAVPVSVSYSAGYAEFTADLTGVIYPVIIDPTFTSQPDATAGVDAIIDSVHSTYNYGTSVGVWIGDDAGDVSRQLIKFDLATLPSDAIISAATLSLWCNGDYASNAGTWKVYRQKRAWVEGTRAGAEDNPATGATWARYDTTNNWQTAGGFGSDDCEQTEIGSRAFTATEVLSEFKAISLTPTTKANLDLGNGWLIKTVLESSDCYTFRSSDYTTAGERPKLVIEYTLPYPTFKAAGTFTAGSGAITPPYPTGGGAPVANDIAILVVESENQAISLTTPNGFEEMGAQANKAAGTAAVDPASRLAVYWKRCAGSDAAPVVAAPGNHATARIYLFSGCKISGNPWNVYAEGNDGGANDLTGVIPGATTTVASCLVFLICTSSYNSTQTTEFGTTAFWANANLANIVERGDNTNTIGLGGGHGSATGEKATAGAYVDTTVSLAHTSYKGAMSIALEPAATIIVEYGAATLSGAGTLAGVAQRLRKAACTLSGFGTVTAAGNKMASAKAVVSGTGSVVAAGRKLARGATSLLGAGTLAGAAQRVRTTACVLSGVGSAVVVGNRIRTTLGTLSGTGSVAAIGTRVASARATVTGAGTVAGLGRRIAVAIAMVAGVGLAVATGIRVRITLAVLSGLGLVQSAGRRLAAGIASAVGQGLAAGKAMAVRAGKGIVQGVGSLTGLAREVSLFSATTSGTGTLMAKGTVIEGGGPPSYDMVELHGLDIQMDMTL
jgi:hypothetical protein